MPNPFESRFAQMQQNLNLTLAGLPAKAGAIVVEHSDEAFRNQGWTDHSLEPWTPRLSEDAKSQGRDILVLTGRLRRSVRIISTTADSVTVGTDVPYAKVHNEGFTGTVRVAGHIRMANIRIKPITGMKGAYALKKQKQVVTKHTKYMRITQRKFLGDSFELREKVTRMLTKNIMAALAA